MARPKRAAHKRHLTELFVKKVKPKTKAFVVWDLRQHHLALRVQPTGARAWKVIYSRHGRPRWYHIGDAGAIGLADARRIAARVVLDVIEGRDPAAERKAERSSGTFADLHAKYLETAKLKNKSWRQADGLIRRYVLPRWAKLAAPSITFADVETLLERIEAPVLSNQTLAAISAVFSWAVKKRILPANPCRGIERNAVKSRERVLSDSEVPRFWSAFDNAGLVTSSALKMILLSGQRPGEVAHMRREHIVDGWWEMPGSPVPALGWLGTKNHGSHRAWLPQPAKKLIDELGTGSPTGFVFTGPRGRPVADLQKAMRDICKKFNIARVTPHDLRRSFLTAVTRLGFSRHLMDLIANHKESNKVTDIYDRFGYSDETKRVMEAVAAHFVMLAEGRPDDNVVSIRR